MSLDTYRIANTLDRMQKVQEYEALRAADQQYGWRHHDPRYRRMMTLQEELWPNKDDS